MTPSAALPGAAVRVMRTAAGRRALQVVLLVGGLFVLGFLCGEQAHADDGAVPTTPAGVVQSARSTADRVVTAGTPAPEADANRSSAATHVTDTVRHGAQPVTDTVRDGAQSATDTVRHVGKSVGELVQPAADTVVRPIGDVVKTVTGGLRATPPDVLPSVPGLPDLPGLPALPGAGAQTPPVGSAPQPSSGVAQRPDVTDGHVKTVHRPDAPADASYGPSGRAADSGGVAVRRDHGGVRAGQTPARQAPSGDPSGALGNQSAVDNGAPRHGDPHAVTSNHRAPLRLAPGASAVVTAAETRDRYRDIPVFPG
ncbi:hypothetical protein GCM10011579_071340 [Streptomyces albiflavescens]|uniref:Uncharacterized protein n=1 Tax=Streptomyces albiflavescens TaxID=1623582 RepID=A0A917YCI5_9ACTN|nr:hypothetical protein [Streptomyces albiflavescens]GGN83023.1 hypothetical protein GCM10011579_071340 [Streptomyces albiflavescens]